MFIILNPSNYDIIQHLVIFLDPLLGGHIYKNIKYNQSNKFIEKKGIKKHKLNKSKYCLLIVKILLKKTVLILK